MGPNNPDLMLDKPIQRNDRIISGSWGFIGVISIVLSALLLLTFHFLPPVLNDAITDGYVFVFVIMVNAPIFYAFSFVSGAKTSIFSKITWRNKFIWMAAIIAFGVNALIIFVPKIQNAFAIDEAFRITDWLVCVALSTIPMWLLEIYKGLKILSNYVKNKNKG